MPSIRAWFGGRRRAPAPAPSPPEHKASVARRLAALTTAGRPQWTARNPEAELDSEASIEAMLKQF